MASIESFVVFVRSEEDLARLVRIGVIGATLTSFANDGVIDQDAHLDDLIGHTNNAVVQELIRRGRVTELEVAELSLASTLRGHVRSERLSGEAVNGRLLKLSLSLNGRRETKQLARRVGLSEEDRIRAVATGISSVNRLVFPTEEGI